MSIQISENSIAIWMLQLNDTTDYVAHLESAENDKYLLTYRFRYYDPTKPNNDPWSGRDRKSWYKCEITQPNAKNVLELTRKVIHAMEIVSGHRAEEILYQGNLKEFLEKVIQRPWAHTRQVANETAKGQFN